MLLLLLAAVDSGRMEQPASLVGSATRPAVLWHDGDNGQIWKDGIDRIREETRGYLLGSRGSGGVGREIGSISRLLRTTRVRT